MTVTWRQLQNDIFLHTSNQQQQKVKWKKQKVPKRENPPKLSESSNLALLYEKLAFLS